jgi:hypothetical protein
MTYKKKYDLIVAGGGPGGFPAAIAAARMGRSVLLLERSAHLGGLLAAGIPPLAYRDRAGNVAVGGIAQELVDRLSQVGATSGHMMVPIQNSMTMMSPAWVRIIAVEMCEEAGVDMLFHADLLRVGVDNGRISGVEVLCKGSRISFETGVLIDATGDGVGLMLSGARYEKGETLQPPTLIFHLGNIDFERALAYMREHPESYRLPDTFPGIRQDLSVAEKFKSWPIMAYFNLVEQAKRRGEFNIARDMIDFVCTLVPGEAILNVTRAPGCDTSDWKSATQAEILCHKQVREVYAFMRKYVPGFENCVISSLPPGVGSRESRRMVGLKRLTAQALEHLDVPDDSIALCGYNVDIHGANNSVRAHEATSAQMSITPIAHAIGVPYGCLVSDSVEGLLASGRLISVDQTIFGMTRIMPTCMACGQAAGTAAALAADQGISPAGVDVGQLRAALRKAGAVVDLPR